MKETLKFILINGMPVWIMLIGGLLLVAGGVNEAHYYNIVEAIKHTWGNVWTKIGTVLTVIGGLLAISYIGFAIKNTFEK